MTDVTPSSTATLTAASLRRSPNALAPYYRRFKVDERLLLTGHSHQAWPDCGFEGQQQAWVDAAEYVDRKWEQAFARAERVRRGWRRLLDDPDGQITLGANTHELVVRLLSALPLRRRPRIVTTDGEFHTLRRQLNRLAEEGIEVQRVAADPSDDLAERLAAALDQRTAVVAVSAVMFRNAHIVPHLAQLADASTAIGAELLIDAYHALDVVPFSIEHGGLTRAFVVGGGYKYCQLGEGNCFLRAPADSDLRPVVTGWFAEFGLLATDPEDRVQYADGSARFAGATYDPTAHYRATEVMGFFDRVGLTPEFLRSVSQHQVELLARGFDGLDLDPALIRREPVAIERLGGFLALRSPQAERLCKGLYERGVFADYRGDTLRLGPAPYLCDSQLHAAITALGETARELGA